MRQKKKSTPVTIYLLLPPPPILWRYKHGGYGRSLCKGRGHHHRWPPVRDCRYAERVLLWGSKMGIFLKQKRKTKFNAVGWQHTRVENNKTNKARTSRFPHPSTPSCYNMYVCGRRGGGCLKPRKFREEKKKKKKSLNQNCIPPPPSYEFEWVRRWQHLHVGWNVRWCWLFSIHH